MAHSLQPDGSSGGAAWDAELTASTGALAGGELAVTLTLADEGPLLEDYRLYVLDLDRSVALGESFELTLSPSEPMRRLRVIVGTDAFATTVAEGVDLTPPEFELTPPYPNPASSAAEVAYGIAEPARVTLEVYDALGRRVSVLVEADQDAGRYTARLGDGLASGVYVVRLRAGSFTETQKVVIVQ